MNRLPSFLTVWLALFVGHIDLFVSSMLLPIHFAAMSYPEDKHMEEIRGSESPDEGLQDGAGYIGSASTSLQKPPRSAAKRKRACAVPAAPNKRNRIHGNLRKRKTSNEADQQRTNKQRKLEKLEQEKKDKEAAIAAVEAEKTKRMKEEQDKKNEDVQAIVNEYLQALANQIVLMNDPALAG